MLPHAYALLLGADHSIPTHSSIHLLRHVAHGYHVTDSLCWQQGVVVSYWRDAGGRSQCVRGGWGSRLGGLGRRLRFRPARSAKRVGRVGYENGSVDAYWA
jgi:hypothetical protein